MQAQRVLLLTAAVFLGLCAQVTRAGDESELQRFVIEREIPGAARMTAAELRDAAARSNQVLDELGPDIQWVQSFVAGDKLYCVYEARDADLILRHAEISGFPADRVTPVSSVIDPGTAD